MDSLDFVLWRIVFNTPAVRRLWSTFSYSRARVVRDQRRQQNNFLLYRDSNHSTSANIGLKNRLEKLRKREGKKIK